MSYRMKTIDGVRRRDRMASWVRAFGAAFAVLVVSWLAIVVMAAAVGPAGAWDSPAEDSGKPSTTYPTYETTTTSAAPTTTAPATTSSTTVPATVPPSTSTTTVAPTTTSTTTIVTTTTSSPTSTTICYEDMPCWDCETMGNRVCGGDLDLRPICGGFIAENTGNGDIAVSVEPAIVTNLVLGPGDKYTSTLDIVAERRVTEQGITEVVVNGVQLVTFLDCDEIPEAPPAEPVPGTPKFTG